GAKTRNPLSSSARPFCRTTGSRFGLSMSGSGVPIPPDCFHHTTRRSPVIPVCNITFHPNPSTMKNSCFAFLFLALLACNNNQAPDAGGGTVASRRSAAHAAAQSRHLYIDVHDLGPGKAPFHEVMAAHRKDLAVEGKHDVHFIKFFVDENN